MNNADVQEFIDLVSEDLRGNLSRDESSDLNRDENLEPVYQALLHLKQDVESQLAMQKVKTQRKRIELLSAGKSELDWDIWLHEEQSYTAPNGHKRSTPSPIDWKIKALKFLSVIESRLSEIRIQRTMTDTSDIIEELVDSIFVQKESLNESSLTEADQHVFELAERLRVR